MPPLHVAIIGSGPSGLYAAQALRKKQPACEIDIIERLPSPFGLIRGGIAPDHQSTKRITVAFDKLLRSDGVRFLGNVEVGSAVKLAEIEAIYDAVVLAYGAPFDNKLNIPGEDKANVFGSNAFVGWYNSHPDHISARPSLNITSAAIIGAGNVALDVARVLAKTQHEMTSSDLAPEIGRMIDRSPLNDIHVLARRGPHETSFSNVELRAFENLTDCVPVVGSDQFRSTPTTTSTRDNGHDAKLQTYQTLCSFLPNQIGSKRRTVRFHFCATPVEILGDSQIQAIRMERMHLEENGRYAATGDYFDVECGLVVTCIGSHARAIDQEPFDFERRVVRHKEGKLSPGLYAVGWAKRGARGTLGTNRTDAAEVVQLLLSETTRKNGGGPAAFDALASKRNLCVITYENWLAIDRFEIDAARAGAPRLKFDTIDKMLDALKLGPAMGL